MGNNKCRQQAMSTAYKGRFRSTLLIAVVVRVREQ